jgi:hypothetical protein
LELDSIELVATESVPLNTPKDYTRHNSSY